MPAKIDFVGLVGGPRDDQAYFERPAATLVGWLIRGSIKPPAHQIVSLTDAPRAHAIMEDGGVRGRPLLIPPASHSEGIHAG
jgi:NADPH:quinone reductase-like Zn-dependent oxidoreductase